MVAAAADSIVFCFRCHDLLTFVVRYSNIIKSEKYLSTPVVCSHMKKQNQKNFPLPYHFFDKKLN